MGTTVRPSCPACGECEVPARAITLRLSSRDAAANHYRFTCPGCDELVERPAQPPVIALLRSTGEVRLVHFEPPHLLERKPSAAALPLDVDEVLETVKALHAATDVIGLLRSSAWNMA